MATVTIELPDELLERVRAGAVGAGLSVDQFISEVLVQALDGDLDEPIDAELEALLAQQAADLAAGRLETRPAGEFVAALRRRHEC